MIKILRAKFHCIRVTNSQLDYHGSVTLDPVQCCKIGILPMEFVDIWNKNSGSRISTYVIYGEPGSRCCVLNGAAARTCQAGDEVIICASEYIDNPRELVERKPLVACFDAENNITEIIKYEVAAKDDDGLQFQAASLSGQFPIKP